MEDIVKVIGIGRLAADPELRSLASGTSVCKLRVVWNNRRKDGSSGEWVDQPCFVDMDVWGTQGENVAKYLAKGRQIGFSARMEQRSWEDDEGKKRYAYQLTADRVQFLGGGDQDGGGSGGGSQREDVPVDSAPPASSGPSAAPADDIPF